MKDSKGHGNPVRRLWRTLVEKLFTRRQSLTKKMELSEAASISRPTVTRQRPQKDKKLSRERAEQMRRYLAGRLGGDTPPGPTVRLMSLLQIAELGVHFRQHQDVLHSGQF